MTEPERQIIFTKAKNSRQSGSDITIAVATFVISQLSPPHLVTGLLPFPILHFFKVEIFLFHGVSFISQPYSKFQTLHFPN